MATKEHARLRHRYEVLLALREKFATCRDPLTELRRLVTHEGLPPEQPGSSNIYSKSLCSLRGRVWKLLLGVKHVDATEYLELVDRGRSIEAGNIDQDAFRTFRTDKEFTSRVSVHMITRVLNAFVHKVQQDVPEGGPRFVYCQGWNGICGVLLYVMPEADAYYTMLQLLRCHMPSYFADGQITGAVAACDIFRSLMQIMDPELAEHLNSQQEGYHIVMFALGCYLNPLFIVSQCITMRETLLASEKPVNVLDPRLPTPIDAKLMTIVCLNLMQYIPPTVWRAMQTHARLHHHEPEHQILVSPVRTSATVDEQEGAAPPPPPLIGQARAVTAADRGVRPPPLDVPGAVGTAAAGFGGANAAAGTAGTGLMTRGRSPVAAAKKPARIKTPDWTASQAAILGLGGGEPPAQPKPKPKAHVRSASFGTSGRKVTGSRTRPTAFSALQFV